MFGRKDRANMTESNQQSASHPHNHSHQQGNTATPIPQGPPPQYAPPPAQQAYVPQQGMGHAPQPQTGFHDTSGGIQGQQHHQAMPKSEGQLYQEHLMTQCARGNHSNHTKFGLVGILVAVFCFPVGLLALCCDKKEVCTRCGHQTL